MKSISILLFTIFVCYVSRAQSYISVSNTLYTNPGDIRAKSSPSIEFGKQFGTISIGFDIGKTNCSKIYGADTTLYFEFRPNLNILQQGRLTNTMTIGIGIVPFATQNLMFEFSSGIEYTCSKLLHVNITFGQYYFSGNNSSYNPSFFGISVIRYLPVYKKFKYI